MCTWWINIDPLKIRAAACNIRPSRSWLSLRSGWRTVSTANVPVTAAHCSLYLCCHGNRLQHTASAERLGWVNQRGSGAMCRLMTFKRRRMSLSAQLSCRTRLDCSARAKTSLAGARCPSVTGHFCLRALVRCALAECYAPQKCKLIVVTCIVHNEEHGQIFLRQTIC